MKTKRTPYVLVDGVRVAVGCGTCAHRDVPLGNLKSPCIPCFKSGTKSKYKLAPEYRGLPTGVGESKIDEEEEE